MKQILLLVLVFLVGTSVIFSLAVNAQEGFVPSWIKSTASFWADGQVSDMEFINSMKYLIENDILIIDSENSIDDHGDFYIVYTDNPNTPFENSSKDWLVSTGYLEMQRDFLNGLFNLPYDVEVLATECGEANMFYDLELKRIIICYEFIDQIYYDFITYYDTEPDLGITQDDVSIMTYDVVDFFFFHEVGHALIDVYELPITGLEENVADQFATLSIFFYEDDPDSETITSQDVLYNVGTWFFIQTQYGHEQAYWGVHNLDIQRFYNISCYAYGHSPEYNEDLIVEGWLPQERASNCEHEYSLLTKSWDALLSPYYK